MRDVARDESAAKRSFAMILVVPRGYIPDVAAAKRNFFFLASFWNEAVASIIQLLKHEGNDQDEEEEEEEVEEWEW